MKTAIYIEDGVLQVVLTPESEHDWITTLNQVGTITSNIYLKVNYKGIYKQLLLERIKTGETSRSIREPAIINTYL